MTLNDYFVKFNDWFSGPTDDAKVFSTLVALAWMLFQLAVLAVIALCALAMVWMMLDIAWMTLSRIFGA